MKKHNPKSHPNRTDIIPSNVLLWYCDKWASHSVILIFSCILRPPYNSYPIRVAIFLCEERERGKYE